MKQNQRWMQCWEININEYPNFNKDIKQVGKENTTLPSSMQRMTIGKKIILEMKSNGKRKF